MLRPKARPDADVAELVRAKLPLVAEDPAAIHVAVEHGCVLLTGDVSSRERAHLVREIAVVRGVDSVVDLLHERESGAPVAAPRPRVPPLVVFVRARWRGPVRLAAAGAGLGLAVAGVRLGGLLGAPLAIAGALLFARAATGMTLRPLRSLGAGAGAGDAPSYLDHPLSPEILEELVAGG